MLEWFCVCIGSQNTVQLQSQSKFPSLTLPEWGYHDGAAWDANQDGPSAVVAHNLAHLHHQNPCHSPHDKGLHHGHPCQEEKQELKQ